jgi:DNA-binding response OmpR family regulator
MIAFVVEDERDQRNSVRDALEEAGWTVELAEDGIAALGRIRRVEPDVILLDLRMPHLGGIEMLKMLRSGGAGREIPVIVTTGMQVDLSVRLLADYVLVKPFGSAELAVALASCASRRSTSDSSASTGGWC